MFFTCLVEKKLRKINYLSDLIIQRPVLSGLCILYEIKRIYYAPISDIHKSKINWKTISEQKDTINGVYELMNGKIYAATSMGAPNFKSNYQYAGFTFITATS